LTSASNLALTILNHHATSSPSLPELTETQLKYSPTPCAVLKFPETTKWISGEEHRGKNSFRQIHKYSWRNHNIYLYEKNGKLCFITPTLRRKREGFTFYFYDVNKINPFVPLFNCGKPVPTKLYIESFSYYAKKYGKLKPKTVKSFCKFMLEHFKDSVPTIQVMATSSYIFRKHIQMMPFIAESSPELSKLIEITVKNHTKKKQNNQTHV
jgi:hypothetical protein